MTARKLLRNTEDMLIFGYRNKEGPEPDRLAYAIDIKCATPGCPVLLPLTTARRYCRFCLSKRG